MKQTVNEYMFCQAFADCGRKDQFSYNGLKALFDYLEDYENYTEEEIELDVIALCCDFCEYDSAVEAFQAYLNDEIDGDDEEEKEENALEYLRDHTQVIEFDGGVIIQNF